MSHLIQDFLPQIENNLIWVRSVRDGIIAWWFNVILLVVVVGGFIVWLSYCYGEGLPKEHQTIPFVPRTWNNGVRNVPLEQYGGQTPQIETGIGLPGFAYRSSAVAF